MVSTALIRDYIVNEDKTSLIREAIANGLPSTTCRRSTSRCFDYCKRDRLRMKKQFTTRRMLMSLRCRVSGIFSTDQSMENTGAMPAFDPSHGELERSLSR
jgi:hypothetical protein